MCTIRKARKVLADAEGALRGLMEEGLKQQRYGDVAQIAALAEGVAKLAAGGLGSRRGLHPRLR